MNISAPNQQNRQLAYRNVAVLVAAQAILGSQMPIYFIVGGLAGQHLAPSACLATLPISMIVFGSMTTAPWLSPLMQRLGRRAGFFIGAAGGMSGALLAALALSLNNFWLLLLGNYLMGIYMSSQGFYRFAATDTAPETYRPKAISYVMAGGLVSALIGPQLVILLTTGSADARVTLYIPVYLAAAILNLIGGVLFLALRIPRPSLVAADEEAPPARLWDILCRPRVAVAVICAAVSFALMNLVMTSTPLAVVGCGYAVSDASHVVSAHVLAMFAPSFVTGHLIARFGAERITGTGLVLLLCAGLVALSGADLMNFFGALILLGIGWNFGFIGATAMLASAHTPQERGRVQGANDLIVFGAVTLASLASGGLMNCAGSDPISGWSAVNLAMTPFLTLAGAALIWLTLRPKTTPV